MHEMCPSVQSYIVPESSRTPNVVSCNRYGRTTAPLSI